MALFDPCWQQQQPPPSAPPASNNKITLTVESGRLKRAQEQTFCILNTPSRYDLQPVMCLTGKSGNICQLSIRGGSLTCTCPDFSKRQQPCKHILFLLSVLNQCNPVNGRLHLSLPKAESLLSGSNSFQSHQLPSHVDSVSTSFFWRPCAHCHTSFSPDDDIQVCSHCARPFHKHCSQHMLLSTNNTCSTCNKPWSGLSVPKTGHFRNLHAVLQHCNCVVEPPQPMHGDLFQNLLRPPQPHLPCSHVVSFCRNRLGLGLFQSHSVACSPMQKLNP